MPSKMMGIHVIGPKMTGESWIDSGTVKLSGRLGVRAHHLLVGTPSKRLIWAMEYYFRDRKLHALVAK